MKTKSFILITSLSILFTPLAMAASAEDLYLKGLELRSTIDGSGRHNRSAALHYFKAACDKKHAKACFEYYLTEPLKGKNATEEGLHLNPYLQKSCKLGYELACQVITAEKKDQEELDEAKRKLEAKQETEAKELVKKKLGIDITTKEELELAKKWKNAVESCERNHKVKMLCDRGNYYEKKLTGKNTTHPLRFLFKDDPYCCSD